MKHTPIGKEGLAPPINSMPDDTRRYCINVMDQIVFETDAAGEMIDDARKGSFEHESRSSLLASIHPEDYETYLEDRFNALRLQAPHRAEYRFAAPDGSWRWVQVTTSPVRDSDGAVIKWIGTLVDVTERRELEDELRRTKNRFELALQKSPITVFEQDADLRYTWAYNTKVFETDESIIGKSDAEYLPPSVADKLTAAKRRVLETSQPVNVEVSLLSRRGVYDHFTVHIEPRFDEAGNLDGLKGVSTQITEMHAAHREALSTQAKLSAALEHMSDSLGICDVEGSFVEFNEAFARFHRFPNKEACTRTLATYPDFMEISQADGTPIEPDNWPLWRAIRGETISDVELRCRRKDTNESWIASCSFAPIRDAEGAITGAVTTARDITERKLAEQELRDNEAHLNIILSGVFDGVIAIGEDSLIKSMNPAAIALFGYSPEEIIGEHIRLIVPAPNFSEAYRREYAMRGESLFGAIYEAQGKRKNGSEFAIESAVNVVHAGEKRLYIAMVRDISARKEAEAHAKALMAEVNHRAKNLLAVVQAVAVQTADDVSPSQFAATFTERLSSLAASHDLVVRSEWHGVDLTALLKSQLSHFVSLIGERIILSGPPIELTPAAAQAIGMAIHELSTNAGKYGALSDHAGKVTITWRLEQGAVPVFQMSWTETDGPNIAKPTDKGFGHSVIVDMLEHSLDAKVTLSYPPSGLIWNFVTHADRLAAP